MKTRLKNQKGTLILASFVMLLFFMAACGGGGQQKAQKERLNEVKESTSQQLQKLKMDIDERIEYIDEQIENASGELEEQLKEVREELKKQKDILEKEMEEVRAASIETWDQVLSSVTKHYQEVRGKTNEVSKKVREMLDD